MSDATQSRAAIDNTFATITVSTDGGLNVMSTEAIRALADAVDRVANAPGVRVAVIRAVGKVFIAGADIKEMAALDVAGARAYGRLGSQLCDAIEALPCVTIAAMQGAALGGGCEIALACDFRIAVESAKIGLPEVTLGLVPGWGGIKRAVRLIGETRAKQLIFSGNPVSARQAEAIGLVSQAVADAAALDEAVHDLKASLSKAGPQAVAIAKRAVHDKTYDDAFADCFKNDESREGMAAFAEKRPANWTQG